MISSLAKQSEVSLRNKTGSGWVLVWHKPFPLHQDASILHNSPDFVDDDLDSDQQPVVLSPCGDVTLHPVVGEVGEEEHAVGPNVET